MKISGIFRRPWEDGWLLVLALPSLPSNLV